MNYLIGSGHFENPYAAIPAQEMAAAWIACIRRYADPAPQRIVIVTAGDHCPKIEDRDLTVIRCTGNLGNLAAGTMRHDFAGWMAPMVITAMIAYNEELDFVFQEQDRLDFGPYIRRMYEDMGDGSMAIGPPLAIMGMPATQSLFIVKHDYIWRFVRDYLALGPDDNDANQGEKKFARLRANNPQDVRVLTFGVDRDRPLPWDDEVWGAQQWSREEFEMAKAKGFL